MVKLYQRLNKSGFNKKLRLRFNKTYIVMAVNNSSAYIKKKSIVWIISYEQIFLQERNKTWGGTLRHYPTVKNNNNHNKATRLRCIFRRVHFWQFWRYVAN